MNREQQQLLRDILRRSGHSVTHARQVVFELLTDSEPQSMHELTQRSKGQIDRASLYRAIKLYEQVGIVQRIYVGWKYKVELTDIFSHHHHHISCLGCGKLQAISEDDELERLISDLAARHKVAAVSHQLEVQGYCASCKLNRAHQ